MVSWDAKIDAGSKSHAVLNLETAVAFQTEQGTKHHHEDGNKDESADEGEEVVTAGEDIEEKAENNE